MNHDLLDLEVAEALAALRKKYPEEQVRMIVAINSDGTVQYTAAVMADDGYSNSEYGWNEDCHKAVEHLISRAGDRNPETRKQARIEALRKELAELDAPLNRPQPAWIKGCSDTLAPHERGLGGEPERRDR